MSPWTTTVPNSVRNSAPVGQTSRQPACVQCLHTSDDISHRKSVRVSSPVPSPGRCSAGIPRSATPVADPEDSPPEAADAVGRCSGGLPPEGCSTKATCRQELAPSSPVLSWDIPSRSMYSPAGTLFHCLHATSQALQPMQTDVSVKKPIRGG